jgi:ribosome maturation factor RimP
MDRLLDDLKKKIQESLQKEDIIVDSIQYEAKGRYKFLTIVLDKVGGIDLDTIVNATHIINPIVDKENLPIEDYILDVVSKERG